MLTIIFIYSLLIMALNFHKFLAIPFYWIYKQSIFGMTDEDWQKMVNDKTKNGIDIDKIFTRIFGEK